MNTKYNQFQRYNGIKDPLNRKKTFHRNKYIKKLVRSTLKKRNFKIPLSQGGKSS